MKLSLGILALAFASANGLGLRHRNKQGNLMKSDPSYDMNSDSYVYSSESPSYDMNSDSYVYSSESPSYDASGMTGATNHIDCGEQVKGICGDASDPMVVMSCLKDALDAFDPMCQIEIKKSLEEFEKMGGSAIFECKMEAEKICPGLGDEEIMGCIIQPMNTALLSEKCQAFLKKAIASGGPAPSGENMSIEDRCKTEAVSICPGLPDKESVLKCVFEPDNFRKLSDECKEFAQKIVTEEGKSSGGDSTVGSGENMSIEDRCKTEAVSICPGLPDKESVLKCVFEPENFRKLSDECKEFAQKIVTEEGKSSGGDSTVGSGEGMSIEDRCKTEAVSICPGLPDKESVLKCVFEPENFRHLSSECQAFAQKIVAEEGNPSGGDSTVGSGEGMSIEDRCKSEALSICPGLTDKESVLKCVFEPDNFMKLSGECQAFAQKIVTEGGNDNNDVHRIWQEIQKLWEFQEKQSKTFQEAMQGIQDAFNEISKGMNGLRGAVSEK